MQFLYTKNYKNAIFFKNIHKICTKHLLLCIFYVSMYTQNKKTNFRGEELNIMKNLKKVLIAVALVSLVAISAVMLVGCANVTPVVKDLVNAEGEIYGEYFGYGVQKGNTDLLNKLNAFVTSKDFEANFKKSKAYHTGDNADAEPLELPNLADNTGVTYTMVTEATYAPYESIGAGKYSYGGFAGCDVDMMVLFCEANNAKLEIIDTEFDLVVEEVKANANYIAAAAMTITEERKESIDFSEPYENSKQVVISSDKKAFTKMEDLKGKKIAVQDGTTACILLDEEIKTGDLKDTGANLVKVKAATDAFQMVKQGKVEAFVLDDTVAKKMINEMNK